MLNDNPRMLVLEAAQITGIKYPRATAIYRAHRRGQRSHSDVRQAYPPSDVQDRQISTKVEEGVRDAADAFADQ